MFLSGGLIKAPSSRFPNDLSPEFNFLCHWVLRQQRDLGLTHTAHFRHSNEACSHQNRVTVIVAKVPSLRYQEIKVIFHYLLLASKSTRIFAVSGGWVGFSSLYPSTADACLLFRRAIDIHWLTRITDSTGNSRKRWQLLP